MGTPFRIRIKRSLHQTAKRSLSINRLIRQSLFSKARCVFVTSVPKAASTYLTVCLGETTGYVPFFLGYHHGNEQDLYLPKLLDSWSMNTVCHHHTRATEKNLALMAEFKIRPVVLTRNIFDSAISLCDHIEREGYAGPIFQASRAVLDLPRSRRLDAIIDLALPWYVDFVVAWQRAEIDKLWLGYDEVVGAPAEAVRRVLAFHGLEYPDAKIDAAIARAGERPADQLRLNKSVSGRGKAELSEAQQQRIRALIRHFPDHDFACLGLGKD